MKTLEKTLAQVANDIETGNNLHEYYNQDGAQIKAGNFETFADFMHYYHHHYRPLLEAIRNGEDITPERRHLLDFMADDLIKMFWEEDESDEDTPDTLQESEDISDTDESDQNGDTSEAAPFFTPGTRYRCIKSVKDAFTAGRIYEQASDPTRWHGYFRNDKGISHTWPQPAEIAHACELFNMKPEDTDPRQYFEAVSE